jgi:hypothetical protein
MPQYLRVSYEGDELGSYGKRRVTKEALMVDMTPFLSCLEYALTAGSNSLLHDTDLEFIPLNQHPRQKSTMEIDYEHHRNETGCAPIKQDVFGKIVLAQQGGSCSDGQKAMEVQKAGGVGILLYGGEEQVEDMVSLDQHPMVRIPVATLHGQDGANLLQHFRPDSDRDGSKISMRFVSHTMAIKSAGQMSA